MEVFKYCGISGFCFLLRFLSNMSLFCPETSTAATPLVGRSSSSSSSRSCDSSGVTKQHATHAWRYTVVGVVVRCIFFVGDSNGRTASIFVTYCGAALLLDHQNCCRGDFWDGVWFSFLMSYKSWLLLQEFQVQRCLCSSSIRCAECLLDLFYVFISFFFFLIDKKKKKMYCSNLNKFLHSKIWPCDHLVKYIKLEHLFMFSQESGYNLMPYDLHPFLIFFMSCQLRHKRLKHHKTNLTVVHVYRLTHQVKHCFYFSNTWEFNLGKSYRVTTWR